MLSTLWRKQKIATLPWIAVDLPGPCLVTTLLHITVSRHRMTRLAPIRGQYLTNHSRTLSKTSVKTGPNLAAQCMRITAELLISFVFSFSRTLCNSLHFKHLITLMTALHLHLSVCHCKKSTLCKVTDITLYEPACG